MKVVIGSCIWRQVEARHVVSLVNVLREPGFAYAPQVGDALIERARSMSATFFLNQTDADIHLSIDSDIADFSVDDVRKVCEQAMTHDIVCALYVTRPGNAPATPTSMIAAGEDVLMGTDTDQLSPLRWGATGFMATHRRVFERLSKELPLLNKSKGDRAFWPFYQTMIVEHDGEDILLSEDYAFCERATRAGFGVWFNPGVRVRHIGQYPYRMEDMGMEVIPPQPLIIRRDEPGAKWSVRSATQEEREPIAASAVPLSKEG